MDNTDNSTSTPGFGVPAQSPVQPPIQPSGQISTEPTGAPSELPQMQSPVQPDAQPLAQPFESLKPPVTPLSNTSSAGPAMPGAVIPPVDVPTPTHPIINPASQGGFNSDLGGSRSTAVADRVLGAESVSTVQGTENDPDTPLKAATPVPGSIGSAISGPAEEILEGVEEPTRTNSVSFNDPANPIEESHESATSTSPKKTSRVSLIALIIVAIMVIIALIAVLVLQLV